MIKINFWYVGILGGRSVAFGSYRKDENGSKGMDRLQEQRVR
jgi:hypothetical protein